MASSVEHPEHGTCVTFEEAKRYLLQQGAIIFSNNVNHPLYFAHKGSEFHVVMPLFIDGMGWRFPMSDLEPVKPWKDANNGE